MYRKVLVANRGEIAVRIIRALRELGISSVAICSEADRNSLHAQLADECICVGGNAPKDSYLNMQQILSAADVTGAQAIHPGFGFLSENSAFARMCEKCGIDFIGPSPDSMDLMGDKAQARRTMKKAGVPVIPGSDEVVVDVLEAKKIADEIGYPVMIKASAGGGGKGMRVAKNEEEFSDLFLMAQKETKSAFNDDRMYLEKFLDKARHIEVQVMADKYGNVVHLGERDCSIQRRHQKLIEESPAWGLSDSLRSKMGKAAVKGTKACGYYSVGTFEFLLTDENDFYFMEMNTRIQVEHPVTEMVTGVDLMREMICISAGEKLSVSQKDIRFNGHAIECRVLAEDPDHRFRPGAGTVTDLFLPGGNGVRVDTMLYSGCQIPPFYDSMLAKVIVLSKTREDAVRKLHCAIGETVIEGLPTNLDFMYQLIGSKEYETTDIDAINAVLEDRCQRSRA